MLAHTLQPADDWTQLPVPSVPYAFGGWLPTGWDCSGALGSILASLGCRSLPGIPSSWYQREPYHPSPASSYKTWNWLYDLTSEPLVAGDFLCWDTHVGIFVEPGMMVSALNTRYGTYVSPFSSGWSPVGETLLPRRMIWSRYIKLRQP